MPRPRAIDGFRAIRGRSTIALVAVIAAGCGDPGAPPAGENLPELRLEEERSLGALEEPPEQVFGRISGLAAGEEGEVWILDGQVPAVRPFDPDGSAGGVIGGEGEGPGEFLRPMGIVATPDGGFAVWDPRNARLSHFDSDGEYRTGSLIPSGLFTANTLSMDGSGRFWILASDPSRERQPGESLPKLWIRTGPDGEIADSVRVPPENPEGLNLTIQTDQGPLTPFTVRTYSAPAWDGGVLLARNDEYVVRRVTESGAVDTLVRRDWERLSVEGEERAQWEAMVEAFASGASGFDTSPGLPARKPVHHLFFTDGDGRIWMRMHVEARPVAEPVDPSTRPDGAPPPLNLREPSVFHVYEPDGTPVGVVELPVRGAVAGARGDLVWVLTQGSLGEPRLIRYRMTAAS